MTSPALLPDPQQELAALRALLGGPVTAELNPDTVEQLIASECLNVRLALREALRKSGMSLRKLADKIDATPSVVCRQLNGEGDIKLSTVVILADALGCRADVSIRQQAPVIEYSLAARQLGTSNTVREIVTATYQSPALPTTRAPAPLGSVEMVLV